MCIWYTFYLVQGKNKSWILLSSGSQSALVRARLARPLGRDQGHAPNTSAAWNAICAFFAALYSRYVLLWLLLLSSFFDGLYICSIVFVVAGLFFCIWDTIKCNGTSCNKSDIDPYIFPTHIDKLSTGCVVVVAFFVRAVCATTLNPVRQAFKQRWKESKTKTRTSNKDKKNSIDQQLLHTCTHTQKKTNGRHIKMC